MVARYLGSFQSIDELQVVYVAHKGIFTEDIPHRSLLLRDPVISFPAIDESKVIFTFREGEVT
ncbi:MAG: hypothetical protein SFY80_05705 [Verrucomicrobiota bacterium]|nr:hypothetical protein [Verrucomicrobiota bacterium]